MSGKRFTSLLNADNACSQHMLSHPTLNPWHYPCDDYIRIRLDCGRVSWLCGLRLALRIQDKRTGQDGAEELFEKQVCSGTIVFKHGSEALVPNIDSLLWNIHLAVGASRHLLGVDTQSAV